jgi:hypothetical protein
MRVSTPILIVIAAATAGCAALDRPAVQGSGVPKEESRAVEPFTGVSVGGVIEATVTPGPETTVRIIGDDNLVPMVETEVRDGRLSVRMRDSLDVRPNLPLKVEVTAPMVASVEATGAVKLHATAGEAARFEARASGATRVTVEGLKADEAALDASGASQVTASGTARSLKAEASGASQVHAGKLAADEAEVNLSGSSSGTARAAKAVRGDVSGASNLRVIGAPGSKAVHTSGASGVSYQAEP